MVGIRAWVAATAISGGVLLAMPAGSQAMPVGPMKVQTATDGGAIAVHYKKKKWKKYSYYRHRHRHYRRWAYCDPWYGCYPSRAYIWGYPGYGYGYPYGYPYGYGPGFYGGSGIGFSFHIH